MSSLFAEALARHKAGEFAKAVELYQQALRHDPTMVAAYSNLGFALQSLGQLDNASAAITAATRLAPGNADLHYNLGNVLQAAGQIAKAEASYREAIRLRPDFAAAYHNLGTLLNEAGEPAEALAAFDRCLELDPACADAWFNRSDLVRFAKGDPAIEAMEALLAKSPSILLHFALGKAWMDAGDAARAFAHFDTGNRMKRSILTYDVAVDLGKMTAAPCVRPVPAAASDRPVFIIGMPRSGTTLVEQILGSHPAMQAAGELPMVHDLVEAKVKDLGRAYLERTAALANGKSRLIDKMPGNFLYAGLIHAALPGAHIIHCRRDAVDTCLSCYTKLFTDGQEFTYDQRELGLYYRAYDKLAAHWRKTLPADRYLEIAYEDVVGDLETAARRLVAFCGLEWDPACLSFYRTKRQIRTASVNQVRQPIHKHSIQRWKGLEPYLQPLLSALFNSSSGADQSPGRT